VSMTPEEFVSRLEAISMHNGEPFGRLALLNEAEHNHFDAMHEYKGYWALSDAFKCFFLQSTELLNTTILPQIITPLSEHFGLFVPRLVNAFRSVCGARDWQRMVIHYRHSRSSGTSLTALF
jgi:hypothetical protein